MCNTIMKAFAGGDPGRPLMAGPEEGAGPQELSGLWPKQAGGVGSTDMYFPFPCFQNAWGGGGVPCTVE